MGIDIYTKWKNQTKEEEESQITGFNTEAGDRGYLREAYHGGPYVTKYLVQEAFDKGEAQIPADALRERLPNAVLMAMYRERTIYGKNESPELIKNDDLLVKIKDVFEKQVKDDSHEEFLKTITPFHLEYAEKLIADKTLPKHAQTFVDFVELCEEKEIETGEPVTIQASY